LGLQAYILEEIYGSHSTSVAVFGPLIKIISDIKIWGSAENTHTYAPISLQLPVQLVAS
jgi:hypothetical protein